MDLDKMNLDKMDLCVCLTEKNLDACLEVIKQIDSNLIEHRIDYMEKIEGLEKIYSDDKKFIATCRNKSCGGKFKGKEEERIDILLNAIDCGVKIVDIEVETNKELIEKVKNKAKEKNVKVIISMHDFEKTPSSHELKKILKKEKELGADIGKIVSKANSLEDSHNLLSLILEAKKLNFPLISFGMGEKAKFSRIMSLFYGAPFTFVSYNEASAPGQLSLKEAKKLIEVLK
jgi:3-dehydroquinate dehydratase I